MEDIQAVCHAMTVFYPGGTERFLEAVLSISEKVRGLARKVVGDFNARAARSSAGDRGGSTCLRTAKF